MPLKDDALDMPLHMYKLQTTHTQLALPTLDLSYLLVGQMKGHYRAPVSISIVL
jgi:hypothetical protein